VKEEGLAIQDLDQELKENGTSTANVVFQLNHEGNRNDSEVGSFLVDLSQQSLREMINIMEKMVVYYGSDAPTQVNELFKTRIHNRFQELVLFLRQGHLVQGIQLMRGIVANGYSLVDIFDAFFKFIKGTEELSEPEKYSCSQLLCRYITIIHTMHEETIEIVLFTNALYKILYIH